MLCEQGFYAYNAVGNSNGGTGAIVCTLCEAGFKCPSPHYSERQACPTGTYSTAGSLNCYAIPSHMYTPSIVNNVRPSWCLSGEYSALTASTCTLCPAGSQCPSDNIIPVACPFSQDMTSTLAYKSFAGEKACFPNLVSYVSPAYTTIGTGYQNWDSVIPAGYYGQPGMPAGASYACPPGKQCLFPQDHNWVSCPPGWYDKDGFYSCQPCPEGIVCPARRDSYFNVWPDPSRPKGAVKAGFFSPYGVNVMLVTPAGWYADPSNSYMIRPCPDGTYSNDQSEACTTCPNGYYCPFNSNSPILCPEGTTSNNAVG